MPLIDVHIHSLKGLAHYEHNRRGEYNFGKVFVTVACHVPHCEGDVEVQSDNSSGRISSRYLVQSTSMQSSESTKVDDRPIFFNEHIFVPYCPSFHGDIGQHLKLDVSVKCIPQSLDVSDKSCFLNQDEVTLAKSTITFSSSVAVGRSLCDVIQFRDSDQILVGQLELDMKWVQDFVEEECLKGALFSDEGKIIERCTSEQLVLGCTHARKRGTSHKPIVVRKVQRHINFKVGHLFCSICPADIRNLNSVASAMNNLLKTENKLSGGSSCGDVLKVNCNSIQNDDYNLTSERTDSSSTAISDSRPSMSVNVGDALPSSHRLSIDEVAKNASKHKYSGDLSLCLGDISSREFTAVYMNK